MQEKTPAQIKQFKMWTWIVSIAVPVVVAALFGVKIEGVDTSFLPPIYATINAITSLVLVSALYMVKKGNIPAHRRLVRFALVLSLLFLASYVAYHMTSESTKYGGDLGMIYYPLLIAHIVLSVVVIPLVMIAYSHAWMGDFAKHKKMVRFAFPIWFFVAVSGVIVYLMISPYMG